VYQETHYYPFGMTMEGEWQNIVNGPENNYLYNGTEKNSDFGLDVNTTFYRTYDPAIGRWWQVDPRAEMAQNYSPYNFSFNSPINYADPNGDFPNPFKWIKKLFSRCKKVKCRSGAGGNKKNKRVKRTKKKSKKNKTKYVNRWNNVYNWDTNSSPGLRGEIPYSEGLNNPVELPIITHRIPIPPSFSGITRQKVYTDPNIKWTTGLFKNEGWAALRNGGKSIYSRKGRAGIGDNVIVSPVLTPDDVQFLNNGGSVNGLNLNNRVSILRLRLQVDELRTFRVNYRGVWPFRKKSYSLIARRHSKHIK
jgi:RHS repeat-associated protein